uniref:Uncharacterized protein n=1 Tax=Rhizophora mucronata TaxID=61149 RepID=A0A2P2NSY3_RHIMU
MHNPSSVKLFK